MILLIPLTNSTPLLRPGAKDVFYVYVPTVYYVAVK